MENISDKILSAVSIMVDNALKNYKADYTIEGKITTIGSGVGEYYINWLGSSILVNGEHGKYSVGDVVYVSVSNNDLSKTRYIKGISSFSLKTSNTQDSSESSYNVKSSNLLYNLIDDKLIISCNGYLNAVNNQTGTFSLNQIKALIKGYMKDFNYIKISFDVKTNIDKNRRFKGEYGIKLFLPFLDESGESIIRAYKLSTNTKMIGDVYNMIDVSSQEGVYEIDNLRYDNSKEPIVEVFCQGFDQDETCVTPDIELSNIGFEFLEKIDSQNNTYSLNILATDGRYFNGSYRDTKKLYPELKLQGNKIEKIEDVNFYWFKENNEILKDNPLFCKEGGIGWECLNEKHQNVELPTGEKLLSYNSINYIDVNEDDVFTTVRYKCVAKYNETLISSIITIENMNNNYELVLTSENDTTNFIKDIGKVRLSCRILNYNLNKDHMLFFYWNRFDENYNYLETIDSNRNDIEFNVNTIDRINTISVSVCEYDSEGVKRFLGTKSITLFNFNDCGYIIDVLNKSQTIKYDSNGNSPIIIDSNFSLKPLSPIIYKGEGVNTELTEEEYNSVSFKWKIPKVDSMIKLTGTTDSTTIEQDDLYYYIKCKDLYFDIEDRYNPSHYNNTVILETQIGSKLFTSYIELNPIKEGDNGTNGTDLYIKIRYLNNNNEIPLVIGYDASSNSFYDISNKTRGDFNSVKLYADVYNNNVKLEQGDYSISWEMLDPSVTNCNLTVTKVNSYPYYCQVKRISNIIWNENITPVNIVKATVKILKGDYNNQEIIAFYPIDIVRYSNMYELDGLYPSLNGGYNNVTYLADGTNPIYSKNVFEMYTDINNAYNDILDYKLTFNTNLSKNKYSRDILKNNQFNIVPIEKFDNGDTKNHLRIEPLVDLSTKSLLENLRQDVINDLHSVNLNIKGVSQDEYNLLNLVKKFDYDFLIDKLERSYDLIKVRSSIISRINEQLQNIENANKTIETHSCLSQFTGLFDQLEHDIVSLKNNLYKVCLPEFRNIQEINYSSILFEDPTFSNDIDKISYLSFKKLITNIQLYFDFINDNILTFNLNNTVKNQIFVFREFYNNLEEVIIQSEIYDNKAISSYLITLLNKILNKDDSESYTYYDITTILNEFRRTIYYYSNAEMELNTTTEKEYKSKLYTYETEKEILQEKINSINRLLKLYGNSVVYVSPIVMLYNRYEMSNLNGWDGSKIYTGKNEEYLLAPQLGAGRKESDNSFTGLIMGLKSTNQTKSIEAGLFGYSRGVQTIELNAEDGSANFGRSGSGQINIVPYGTSKIAGWEINSDSLSKSSGNNRVVLNSDSAEDAQAFLATNEIDKTYIQYNGFFFTNKGEIGNWILDNHSLNSKNGGISLNSVEEKITLADGAITLDGINNEINCGTHFKVDKDGNVFMNSGNVGEFVLCETGLHNADETLALSSVRGLIAKKGTIGGWTIEPEQISTIDGSVYLNKNGSAKFGEGFEVDKNGKITATAGHIGGWVIGKEHLRNEDNTVQLNMDGSVKFGANFEVTNKGVITAKSGTIGDWILGNGYLRNEAKTVQIKAEGTTKFGDDFTVTSAGVMTAKSGTIGGWEITGSQLKGGSVLLKKTGDLSGSLWSITAAGLATFSNINATGGKVGGWTIGTSKLVGGSLTLENTGKITGSAWDITAGGKATFSDINVTGGKIAIAGSGTTINNTGAALGTNTTKVGGKVIGTYVGDICADTIKATKIKTSQLEVDSVNGKTVRWASLPVVTSLSGKVWDASIPIYLGLDLSGDLDNGYNLSYRQSSVEAITALKLSVTKQTIEIFTTGSVSTSDITISNY